MREVCDRREGGTWDASGGQVMEGQVWEGMLKVSEVRRDVWREGVKVGMHVRGGWSR